MWHSPRIPCSTRHLKGFLPQCVCRCCVSVELLPKFVPHTPHEGASGARGCYEAELPGAVGQVLHAWFRTLLRPYYRRLAGSVCSKASWWWCPLGAPALVEAQCTLAERARDSGGAALASASGTSVAAEPGGVGSGRATGARFGAGRGGCCAESSGSIRCRYRASGQRGCVSTCAAGQLRHSARRSPGSGSGGRCCWARLCHSSTEL